MDDRLVARVGRPNKGGADDRDLSLCAPSCTDNLGTVRKRRTFLARLGLMHPVRRSHQSKHGRRQQKARHDANTATGSTVKLDGNTLRSTFAEDTTRLHASFVLCAFVAFFVPCLHWQVLQGCISFANVRRRRRIGRTTKAKHPFATSNTVAHWRRVQGTATSDFD